jgi:hypothetical protein
LIKTLPPSEAEQLSGSNGAHSPSPPSYSSTPTMVPGVMAAKGKALVCGGLHTVLLGATGALLAWGANHEGQAGVGRLDPNVPSPEKIYSVLQAEGKKEPAKKSPAASAPAKPKVTSLEPKGSAAVRVSCGYSHTIMLTDKGEVYACGASTYGQLGTSGSESVLSLKKLDAIGLGSDRAGPTKGQQVVEIIAGDFHTSVRIQDGTWWSWGRNNRGQLAVGTLDASSQPLRVPQIVLFPPTGGANLSGGHEAKEDECQVVSLNRVRRVCIHACASCIRKRACALACFMRLPRACVRACVARARFILTAVSDAQEPLIIVAGGLHSIVVVDRIGE